MQHLTGLARFGGKRATPEQVALVLNQYGDVLRTAGGDAGSDEDGGGAECAGVGGGARAGDGGQQRQLPEGGGHASTQRQVRSLISRLERQELEERRLQDDSD